MARDRTTIDTDWQRILPVRKRRRVLLEIAIAYVLILVVIWTPRPYQRWMWWIASASVVVFTCVSFDGFNALGLRRANFLRSLWVVGAALLIAGADIAVAAHLNTLLKITGPSAFFRAYFAYAIWAFVQQFLLQGFFLLRLKRLFAGDKAAALAAATLFALAHLPNPILTPITFVWGTAACLIFLRYRNLYPLAIAHAIFGIAIAITVPGPVDHNMRVGLGYLRYHHLTHRLHRN
jgi:Type II CAAX prenyl endopeptidase Rce1-like